MCMQPCDVQLSGATCAGNARLYPSNRSRVMLSITNDARQVYHKVRSRYWPRVLFAARNLICRLCVISLETDTKKCHAESSCRIFAYFSGRDLITESGGKMIASTNE